MKTICISDLHLGDRGARDNFAYGAREDRFLRFLDYVEAEKGRLLILGDLFEWWQTNLAESVLAYISLIERLGAMGAVWVPGNHDNALSAFVGTRLMPQLSLFRRAEWTFTTSLGGRRFCFLHGHEADPYCRDSNPGMGQVTAIVSGLREDRKKSPFDGHGRAVEDESVGTLERIATLWRGLIGQPGRLEELIHGVESHRKSVGADVVVYGHTHTPGRIGNYHYNCGSWCRRQDTFVEIDDHGQACVRQWTSQAENVPYDVELAAA